MENIIAIYYMFLVLFYYRILFRNKKSKSLGMNYNNNNDLYAKFVIVTN